MNGGTVKFYAKLLTRNPVYGAVVPYLFGTAIDGIPGAATV